MLRLLATEHVGNVTSRKHSWKMYSFHAVYCSCSLRKYCSGKEQVLSLASWCHFLSEIKMAARTCIMPQQREKYIKKYVLSYFSGQPAVAGNQTSSQEKQSLKLGWPEKHRQARRYSTQPSIVMIYQVHLSAYYICMRWGAVFYPCDRWWTHTIHSTQHVPFTSKLVSLLINLPS